MSARRRLIDGFKDQFEPEGDGYVYWVRRDKKGYQVSAAERERFVAAFARRAAYVAWVVNGWVLLALYAAASYLLVGFGRVYDPWYFFAALAVPASMLLLVTYCFGVWPDAELRGRATVSHKASRRSRRTFDLAKRSWLNIAWSIAFSAMCLVNEATQPTRSAVWHWIVVLLASAACLYGCFDLVAKLRLVSRTRRG